MDSENSCGSPKKSPKGPIDNDQANLKVQIELLLVAFVNKVNSNEDEDDESEDESPVSNSAEVLTKNIIDLLMRSKYKGK